MDPQGTPLLRGYLPNGELEMFTSLEHYITTMIDLERKEAEEARAGTQQSSDIPQKEETPSAAGLRIYIPPGAVIPGVPFPPQTAPSCSEPNHSCKPDVDPKGKLPEPKNLSPEQRCNCNQCDEAKRAIKQYIIDGIYMQSSGAANAFTNIISTTRERQIFEEKEDERRRLAYRRFLKKTIAKENKRRTKFETREKLLAEIKPDGGSKGYAKRLEAYERKNKDKIAKQQAKFINRQEEKYQKRLAKFKSKTKDVADSTTK